MFRAVFQNCVFLFRGFVSCLLDLFRFPFGFVSCFSVLIIFYFDFVLSLVFLFMLLFIAPQIDFKRVITCIISMILFLFWFDHLNCILQFLLFFKNKIMLLSLRFVFENRQFLYLFSMPENRFSHFLKTSQSCNASHETQNSAKKRVPFLALRFFCFTMQLRQPVLL